MTLPRILYVLCIVALCLELSLYAFPFVLVTAIVLYLVTESTESLLFIFVLSFILDAVSLHPLGLSAISIFATILIIALYQAKFEVKSAPFISLVSFWVTSLYAYVSSYEFSLWVYILVPVGIYLVTSVIFSSKKVTLYE